MTLKETFNFIHGTLKFGSVLGLESISRLMEKLGNPEDSLKFIHIAGTNGKGSVASIIASCLTEAGFKTGLYTSPALLRFTERIRVDGAEISHDDLCICAKKVKEAALEIEKEGNPHPTEFEIVTAIAFLYFKSQNCDFVVLETGLGGRLDATNVIKTPVLTVITSISLDHTDRLGETLSDIAEEKCGIIKNCPTVTTVNQEKEALSVILAHDKNAHLAPCLEILEETPFDTTFKTEEGTLTLSLSGAHQAENAGIALYALKLLGIEKSAVREGFMKVRHRARLEVLRKEPLVILDGAHNVSAMEGLKKYVSMIEGEKVLIIGMLKDKDYKKCAEIIAPVFDEVIAVDVKSPRALLKEDLKKEMERHIKNVRCMALSDALSELSPGKSYVIAGSLYMAGEAIAILEGKEPLL